MGHDLFDVALGLVISALGWLIVYLIRGVDSRIGDCENRAEKHAIELRDCRSAIARVENQVDLDPFPYTY